MFEIKWKCLAFAVSNLRTAWPHEITGVLKRQRLIYFTGSKEGGVSTCSSALAVGVGGKWCSYLLFQVKQFCLCVAALPACRSEVVSSCAGGILMLWHSHSCCTCVTASTLDTRGEEGTSPSSAATEGFSLVLEHQHAKVGDSHN